MRPIPAPPSPPPLQSRVGSVYALLRELPLWKQMAVQKQVTFRRTHAFTHAQTNELIKEPFLKIDEWQMN